MTEEEREELENGTLPDHSHWCLGCDSAWMEKGEECVEEFARAADRTYSFKLCPPCDAPFDFHEAEVGA